MKATNVVVTIMRYVVVLAVLITTWVAYYMVIRWATADCWFMKMDIKAAQKKMC